MLEKQPLKQSPNLQRQCELLDLSRSTAYYQKRFDPQRKAFELKLLGLIDELYTAQPSRGRYGMRDALAEEHNITVNHKRIRRLMRKLGKTGRGRPASALGATPDLQTEADRPLWAALQELHRQRQPPPTAL